MNLSRGDQSGCLDPPAGLAGFPPSLVDLAVVVDGAGVLDVALDGSFEESFAGLARGDSVVVTAGDVATHQTGPLAGLVLLLDQILRVK